MLNTTNNNSKTVINTPASGIMQKSNPKSFFLKMHHNSKLADALFDAEPEYKHRPVFVIQVLLMSDNWIMAEVVYKEDF